MKRYSLNEFYKSIGKSEKAIAQGKVKSHAEVRNIIDSWKQAVSKNTRN